MRSIQFGSLVFRLAAKRLRTEGNTGRTCRKLWWRFYRILEVKTFPRRRCPRMRRGGQRCQKTVVWPQRVYCSRRCASAVNVERGRLKRIEKGQCTRCPKPSYPYRDCLDCRTKHRSGRGIRKWKPEDPRYRPFIRTSPQGNGHNVRLSQSVTDALALHSGDTTPCPD